MVALDKRALVAGALVVWAGVLIYDMQRLKGSAEFKRSDLSVGSSVRVFGVRVDDGAEKQE
jgi:hypothetical protein